MLEIRKNLVSGSVLSKKGFKLVFEGNTFVMSKGDAFVGKGYLDDGLFKLNVTPLSKINENASSSAYVAVSFDLWHSRLGHVNTKSLNKLVTSGLIPKCTQPSDQRCEICVESKYARKPFK